MSMQTLNRERLYLPQPLDSSTKVAPGHISILGDAKLRKSLGIILGIAGGDRGYNTEGDIVTQTVDGVDLNTIWNEFRQTLDIRNRQRNVLVDFLSYTVSEPVVTVPQFTGQDDFELASEFGVPKSMKPQSGYFQMGFDFDWYDTASRFTWKFLADATAEQIQAIHNNILEADNRLVFNEIMRTLFRNTNRTVEITQRNYTVYAFYNADGTVPPPYKATTHLGTHQHYLASGAATVDSGDVEAMIDHLDHHGYSRVNGADIFIMVNRAQGDAIRTWKANVVNANGATAKYDFIPSTNQPTFVLPQNFVTSTVEGVRPPGVIRGMYVIGSYGDAFIVQEDYMPAGYMVGFATGGSESLTNPIGIREHSNAALRGLRIVKGRQPDYPLQDSYYQRGFGSGIRQRGAGVVMQITAGAYTVPAIYA